MKSWARELALGLLLATAIPAPVLAAQSAEQILLDKANYWRLKDRPDLATEALQQLLSINPNQPEALYQFGVIKVQQGRLDDARVYLGRLQKAAPSSPRVADLENAIRAGQVSPNELGEARRLAQSGQFSQAAEKYQQTFKGPPPSTFGVEYYMTLAGTPALGRGAGRSRTAGAELAKRQQGQAGPGAGLHLPRRDARPRHPLAGAAGRRFGGRGRRRAIVEAGDDVARRRARGSPALQPVLREIPERCRGPRAIWRRSASPARRAQVPGPAGRDGNPLQVLRAAAARGSRRAPKPGRRPARADPAPMRCAARARRSNRAAMPPGPQPSTRRRSPSESDGQPRTKEQH